MDLHQRFEVLDENLKLDPVERKRAIAVHHSISDRLLEAGLAKRTRLQGSFARKTMLPPLHDIDMVIELADWLQNLLATPDGPEQAMKLIRAVLKPRFPGARFAVFVLTQGGDDRDEVAIDPGLVVRRRCSSLALGHPLVPPQPPPMLRKRRPRRGRGRPRPAPPSVPPAARSPPDAVPTPLS